MNYEKLNVDRFIENAQAGKYAGLTGARRAIGKTDWSDKDKKRAHEFADKYFADGAHSKKTAKPAKVAKVKAAKRQPKAAKPKAEKAPRTIKKAKKSAAAAPAPPKRASVPPKAPRAPVTQDTPSVPRLMHGDDPSTVRQHAASSVIAALRNTGPLNPREQKAYDIATVEYSENARESARRVVEAASGGLPFLSSAAESAPASEPSEVVVPPGTAPRVAVPTNGAGEVDVSSLSPELRAQHERLKRAAAAAGATEGPPPRG